ncbi:hypothetical protein ASPBRDRAFT_47673 [Aspergillus brasiliensis CBS 101740]|uniref:Xylanolytic transcriptional activator regulatory domain-containing protein n=1 Tax=Aspergillus brasiliensis (strain CBS 101740 / IMI 381727 / IBT 21946) TaxID=767769 RepID=A0A1L9U7I4_ASPBC|nr:hypothetical protein ASPBRDRAFT_47673 [Aspergillus brasiliensis CBS 101740]
MIDSDPDQPADASRSMSIGSENDTPPSTVSRGIGSPLPGARGVAQTILKGLKDENTRSLLSSNVFCHLKTVESRFWGNEKCIQAIEVAMREISKLENVEPEKPKTSPVITKETAHKWIELYYENYKFEGFRIPFEKDFILSLPGLLHNPHVQLDETIRIVYYNVLFQGFLLDAGPCSNRGAIVEFFCRSCMELTESWLAQIKNTPADLFAAFFMMSMSLEACNSELSWRIVAHACSIARALGYFSVDADQPTPSPQMYRPGGPPDPGSEIEKNRMRFEFWHLLRTDCVFRLSFGKPALIPAGSWTVHFPDPSITGVDDASTRFIQIHFFASMRLTLVLIRYLDLVDAEPVLDTPQYDRTIDGLIAEVQTIMSDWSPEELLTTTTNRMDTWFCVDILFSSYKMLIVFYQAKKCNQDSQFLPYHTVDIARKSLQMSRSIMSSSTHPYWGISLILLHQFVPLFIVSMNMIGSPECENAEADLDMVSWFNQFVETAAQERGELKPLSILMKAMTIASQNSVTGSN